jgi:hypothetical protein
LQFRYDHDIWRTFDADEGAMRYAEAHQIEVLKTRDRGVVVAHGAADRRA